MPVPRLVTSERVTSHAVALTDVNTGARFGIEANSLLAVAVLVKPRADFLRTAYPVGLAGSARPPHELVLDGGRVEPARGEQDVAVKPEVGELLDQALVALAGAGERGLDALLAELLRGRRRAVRRARLATYEPSGRVAARSATVRQSQGAKQESEPVWQAGPVGRTRTRIASPSQSSRSSSTASVLPDVSPLRQSRRARAAAEVRLAGLAREAERLVVHPGEHEDAARVRVLDDRRPELRLHREAAPRGRGARRGALRRRAGLSCRIDARSAAWATSSASATWLASPAPPEAITGIETASATARVSSRS